MFTYKSKVSIHFWDWCTVPFARWGWWCVQAPSKTSEGFEF